MEFQEFTGDNVDLAINEACTRLQVPSFELEYEVINKESAGFLGFGKKLDISVVLSPFPPNTIISPIAVIFESFIIA